jgi:hypothetical protein
MAARPADLDVDHPRRIGLQRLAGVVHGADAFVQADRRADARLQGGMVVDVIPGQRLFDIVQREIVHPRIRSLSASV